MTYDDHEHPCPTVTGCIESLRKRGYNVADGVDCCVCWLRQYEDDARQAFLDAIAAAQPRRDEP